MKAKHLIMLLQQLPPDEDITIPFPYPDKDNLIEHEPFILSSIDGTLLLPQSVAELYLKENPDDVIR